MTLCAGIIPSSEEVRMADMRGIKSEQSKYSCSRIAKNDANGIVKREGRV